MIKPDDNQPLAPRPTIWFEIEDLLSHLRSQPTPSGIARVVLEILRAGLDDLAAGTRLRLCRYNAKRARFEVVDIAVLRRLLRPAPAAGRYRILALASTARDFGRSLVAGLSGRPSGARAFAAQVRPGDVVVNLGATWGYRRFPAGLDRAKRRHGFRYAMLLHDIIPQTHPDLCSPGFVRLFRQWLGELYPLVDQFLTPSRHSAEQLQALARASGWPVRRVDPVRFGSGHTPASRAAATTQPVHDKPYVLFVSTIEPRKNHLFLLQIWQDLIARHGASTVPDLVWIGKLNPMCANVAAELAATGSLGGKIIHRAGLSDAALARAYDDCLFTVFPSRQEGWGLPVEESLAHGKICLCARATSLPEVGGDLVDYFDPEDPADATACLERALFAPGYLAERETRLRRQWRPTPWRETLDAVIDRLDPAAGRG